MQASSIDKCQGDEADGVVLSLVMTYVPPSHRRNSLAPTSAWSGAPHSQRPPSGSDAHAAVLSPLSNRAPEQVTASDFVQYPNRVNVAISRARYAVVVVCSDSVEQSMKRAGNRTTWGPLLGAAWQVQSARQPLFVHTPALHAVPGQVRAAATLVKRLHIIGVAVSALLRLYCDDWGRLVCLQQFGSPARAH